MKVNKLKYAIISASIVFAGMTTGWDTLDIDNLNSYDESMVWDNPDLATAYVNNLYTENFNGWDAGADSNSDILTGMPWYLGTITETGDAYKSWRYTEMRHINEDIMRLEGNEAIDKDLRDNLLGQTYFMRAFVIIGWYYIMVVSLILKYHKTKILMIYM